MQHLIAMTGASGFAGAHAVRELVRRGHRVRALVRDPRKATFGDNVDIVQGDLLSEAALRSLLDGADTVVHLAGTISALSARDYFRTNAEGTSALAEAAAHQHMKRFVHVSSLSARAPHLSAYGASKKAGEDAVVSTMHGHNAVIIRPPAVYGPGDRATLPLLQALTRRTAIVPGRSDARFSLIHATDLALLIADAVTADIQGIHEVSDGTPGGYGWPELLEIAGRASGHAIRPVYLPQSLVSAVGWGAETWSKLSRKPGMVSRDKVRELYHRDWVARDGALRAADPITFSKGFPETLAWYRAAGWLPAPAAADRSETTLNKDAAP